MAFVNLHGHSSGSQLDCSIQVPQLIKKCEQLNMSAVAITDHGNMSSMLQLYEECKKSTKVKPIFAFEAYFVDDRKEKTVVKDRDKYDHLTLLAKNQVGLSNLQKMTSIGYLEGFYSKPRIDWDCIKRYSEGVIALSGCVVGRIPKLLGRGQDVQAYQTLQEFKAIFEDFYIEIQPCCWHGQLKVNPLLIDMAEKTDTPIVITTDAHYLEKEDFEAHEILLCMQTGSVMSNPNRFSLECPEFYFAGEEDIRQRVSEQHHKSVGECLECALENTVKVADMCNVELDLNNRHFPIFSIPEDPDFLKYYIDKKDLFELI